MSRPEPTRFQVVKSERVTPNMHRIVLGGSEMRAFPPEQQGGYVKLMLPDGDRRIVRTYTIRHQGEDSIAVDFALHGEGRGSGPATAWALGAVPGQELLVGGPGPAKPLPSGKGWYLLCGDMTALPAISVNLESLPETATGHAVLEIQNEDDRQEIAAPPGVELHWLINPQPGARPENLERYVREIGIDDRLAYAWAACEFEGMRRLRQYLRGECALGTDRLYISSYWKRGLIEDDHRQAKRADLDTVGEAAS